MKIVATYDFNGGEKVIERDYKSEYAEVENIIRKVDAEKCKTKESEEKTSFGEIFYSPSDINKEFSRLFGECGWGKSKILCDYKYGKTTSEYRQPDHSSVKPFREMDFVKPNSKLGIEVQFGKYAFMVYNVCAKMTIFRNEGIINAGIEIVPVKMFANEMSTGVSYFEQFAWDLTKRGVSSIDVPVLILGIDI